MQIEYIRREDMLNAVEKLDIIPSVDGMGNPTNAEDFRVQFLGTVLKVEPADVVRVVHAYWIQTSAEGEDGNAYYSCSNCGSGESHNPIVEVPYCWKCGAKMDAQGEE